MRFLKGIRKVFSRKRNIHHSIKSIFGFKPYNIGPYLEALAHKSYSKGEDVDNERLEFLGDTVLDLIVAHRLYKEYPDAHEGKLTKVKSKIVSREHLLSLAKELELSTKLPVKKQKSLDVDNIIGNVLEALIGAIYLDQGYNKTEEIINQLLDDYVDLHQLKDKIVDFKSKVHEWAQINRKEIHFQTVSIGNLEDTLYRSELFIEDEVKGFGEARNKKIAQRKASEMAWGLIDHESKQLNS
ncbi:MAG: ribonuclease-3 [Glaciecola sp.]